MAQADRKMGSNNTRMAVAKVGGDELVSEGWTYTDALDKPRYQSTALRSLMVHSLSCFDAGDRCSIASRQTRPLRTRQTSVLLAAAAACLLIMNRQSLRRLLLCA